MKHKNTPKIAGFVAEKDIMVFIYRKSRLLNYLVHLKYDKRKHKFTLGSKFYGRFYPSRCDLSPDGKHFLYFVMGNYAQNKYKEFYPCWSVLCSPPNITANVFVGHYDTWLGGGQFLDDKSICINSNEPIKQKKYCGYEIIANEMGNLEQILKYRKGKKKYWEKIQSDDKSCSWRKNNGKITLIKKYVYDKTYSKGEYDMYEYKVVKNSSQESKVLECNWLDFDNFGRVIVASGSEVLMYEKYQQIKQNKPKFLCDFEQLITKKEKK